MGQVMSICSQKNQNRLFPRVTQLIQQAEQQKNPKKLLVKELTSLIPCKYLGKGLYGTTLQVFDKDKDGKLLKFAQKIIPESNLNQNYILYESTLIKKLMSDSILKNKLVKVHGFKIDPDKHKMYLVMDLMKKGDLYFHLCQLMKKNGRFYPEKAIKRVAFQVLQILERFHFHDTIFRNVRAENIFIKQNGKLSVSDFFFSINGLKCHSYYGAAQYAPPQVFKLQKKCMLTNQTILKNLNQISQGQAEQRELRLSPDVRRIKLTNDLKTKSLDLQQLGILKKIKIQSKEASSPNIVRQSRKHNTIKIVIQQPKNVPLKQKNEHSIKSIGTHSGRLAPPSKFSHSKSQQKHQEQHQKQMTFIIPEQSPQYQHHIEGQHQLKLTVKNQSQIHISESQFQSNSSDFDNGQYDHDVKHPKKQINQTIDIWMLGVLLFQLIFRRTPFEQWKSSYDILSKTPACDPYEVNLKDLEHSIRNRDIQEIWGTNSETLSGISHLQRQFIQKLFIREVQDRKSPSQLLAHSFLQDVEKQTHMLELIYDQHYDEFHFEKNIRHLMRYKDNGLMASRTNLRKASEAAIQRERQISEQLFQHEKSFIGTR